MKTKVQKTPKKYFFIRFNDPDGNNLSDIEVNECLNDRMNYSAKKINSMANHFLTKKEATTAKRAIWNALKSKKI